MPEQTISSASILSGAGADDLIAGYSLKFYWRAMRLFLLLILALDILNIIFGILAWGHWLAEAFGFMIFNYWLWQKWHLKIKAAITASIILGISTGVLLAIFDVIWYHKVWYLLNIIRLPVIIGVVGLLVAGVISIIFNSIRFNKSNKEARPVGPSRPIR